MAKNASRQAVGESVLHEGNMDKIYAKLDESTIELVNGLAWLIICLIGGFLIGA